jgi:hypothetical protein
MLPRVVLRARLLASLSLACAPCTAPAQATPGSWYLNADVGGIIPDKPWGARGSAPLFGLDIGNGVAAGWGAELDLSYTRLDDRRGSGHSSLEGGALEMLRIFQPGARFSPYVSFGAGVIHEAPGFGSDLLSRTEFMAQPGVGALIGSWNTRVGGLALRADLALRWTHGWAHAPGNPVDPLYTLGLTYSLAQAGGR